MSPVLPSNDPATSPDDIIITPQLATRPPRSADHAAENRGLVALAHAMRESPQAVLQELADVALQLCRAGSAGVSIEESLGGMPVFRWHATAGRFRSQQGAVLPRHHSPCGEVLDRNSTLLMADPARVYSYIGELGVPLHEVLLVPFSRAGKAVGTIWVVSHEPEEGFDAEDARLIESLAYFAAAATDTLHATERAQSMAEAARANEARVVAILESVTDAFVALDSDWRFTYVNRQAEDVLSRKPDELVGEVLWEVFPGLAGTDFERAYRKAATEKVSTSLTAFYPDHGRWYEARAYPATNGITVYFRDVSAHIRAEETIRESEERYRGLFTSIDEGFCVIQMLFDDDGQPINYRFLETNPAFEKHTGLTQAVGKTALEMVPTLEGHWFETYGKVARTGQSVRFVNEARALDERWFDVYAFRLGGPGSDKVALLFNDITERRRMEIAIQDSEQRFRTLADSAPVLIWQTDARGIEFVNRAYLDFFGKSFEEIRGGGWQQFLHPDDVDHYARAYRLAVAERNRYEVQARFRRHDGQYRWLLNVGLPHCAVAGEQIGFVGCSSDITDIKNAEQAQRRIAGELAEADRRKDEFLALLAHELRNPLAPLRNGLAVMRLAKDADVITRSRDMMERQLAHMVRLIDDLLDVSRIGSNKMALRRSPVLLADVVASGVETARPFIEAAGHSLEIVLPTQPVTLYADDTRLAQVVSNLLNNSAKYTPHGGHIWLSAQVRPAEIEICVRDSGIGIPADALTSIFDMFSQVDRSVERARGGLGIGLALVKGLVQLHGGSVSVHSDGPGQGSAFTVRIPRETAQSDQHAPQSTPAPDAPAVQRRILVVDDSRDSAASMAMMLELVGNEIAVAHDGVEAIEVAEQFNPDVILMDIGMPRLNGHDATRQIRSRPWGKDIVIVALTGWGQDADRQRAREAGCDGHLVKPVSLADLEKVLAEKLPGR